MKPNYQSSFFLIQSQNITLGSQIVWCQSFRRRRGGENLWARPVEFHFHDVIYCFTSGLNTTYSNAFNKTYSLDQFYRVCQCYIAVFGRRKCNIFSGKISNELVHWLSILETKCLETIDDNRHANLSILSSFKLQIQNTSSNRVIMNILIIVKYTVK